MKDESSYQLSAVSFQFWIRRSERRKANEVGFEQNELKAES
jgi:hypothetical protein